MAELALTLFLNGLMATLLLVTIIYCSKLNRRIRILQDSRSELAHIIRQFDESTQRATQSIAEIHQATNRIAENIQHKIDKANYIADDLQFMIEKGGKLADKMEGGISASRPQAPSSAASRRSVRDDAPTPVANDMSQEKKEEKRAGLEAVLRKINPGSTPASAEVASGAQQGSASESRRSRPGARLRSKAEQELFEALKNTGGKA